MAGGAENRKRHERKYQRVEPGDHRRAGDTGVAEYLRHVDRGGASAREYIAQHPAAVERPYAAEEPYGHEDPFSRSAAATPASDGGLMLKCSSWRHSPCRRSGFHLHWRP